jgi:hypothetical protein
LIFNPTGETINRQLSIPLYYTGLKSKAFVFEKDKTHRQILMDGKDNMKLEVSIPGGGYTWYVIRNVN